MYAANNPAKDKIRYELLDGLRGLSLVSMIIFHLCYDVFIIFGVNSGWTSSPFVSAWERSICASFILISGACSALSSAGLRRGILINLAGFAVTAVTVLALPEQAVWFGILNLLGCAMIVFGALKTALCKINPLWGAAAAFLLFAVFYGLPKGYAGIFGIRLFELPDVLYSCNYLAFLGLPSHDFFSSDYFPLVPWIFLYALGFFLWRLCERQGWARFFKAKIPLFGTMGKYSLWIYLAHQPVLMGVLWLVFNCGMFF